MSRANPRFHRTNAALPALTTPAYRITAFFTVDGQSCLYTQDYIMTTTAQSTNAESNLASSWHTAVLTNLRNCLASDVLYLGAKCQCLSTPSRLPYSLVNVAATQPGLVAGAHMPSEMSAIISKSTSTKGQHGRGRFYVPGIPVSFVVPSTDANRLTPSAVTNYTNLANAMMSASITDGANVAMASVTTRVLRGLATVAGQVLTQMIVRALLGTTRRRRIGRGK